MRFIALLAFRTNVCFMSALASGGGRFLKMGVIKEVCRPLIISLPHVGTSISQVLVHNSSVLVMSSRLLYS